MRGWKECKTFWLRKGSYGSIQISKEADFKFRESDDVTEVNL